jgi:hypothetical protein
VHAVEHSHGLVGIAYRPGWPPRGAPGRSPDHAASRPVRTGIAMRSAPPDAGLPEPAAWPHCPRPGSSPHRASGISDGWLGAPLAQPAPARHDRPGSRGSRTCAATSPPGPGCGRTSHISDGGSMGRVLHKTTIAVCQNENLSCIPPDCCGAVDPVRAAIDLAADPGLRCRRRSARAEDSRRPGPGRAHSARRRVMRARRGQSDVQDSCIGQWIPGTRPAVSPHGHRESGQVMILAGPGG